MSEKMTVRALTENDWNTFSLLRLEALKECPGLFSSTYGAEKNNTPEEWKKWLEQKNDRVYGLFKNDNLVGFQGIAPDKNNPKAGLIWGSYIRRRLRGKGHSIGLYKACIDWGINNLALEKITVSHRESNIPSRQANQHFGFKYINRLPKKWPDGVTEDELNYELLLDPLRNK